MELKRLNLQDSASVSAKLYDSRDLVSLTIGTSSKGNQEKWVTRDSSVYIKGRFFNDGLWWRDDLVELIASQYARLCTLPVDVVQYRPCLVDGEPAVESDNFCTSNTRYMPFSRVCSVFNLDPPEYWRKTPKHIYDFILHVAAMVDVDYSEYLDVMLLLDFVVGNEDRHFANFGFLYNDETHEFSLAPIFDFGLGLFEPDTKYQHLKFSDCLHRMLCKPFCVGSDLLFEELIQPRLCDLSCYLPSSISVAEFTFPSEKAETLFRNRNLKLGVKLT